MALHPDLYSDYIRPRLVTAVVSFDGSGVPTLQQWQPQSLQNASGYTAAGTTAPSGSFGGPGTQGVATFARISTDVGHFLLTLGSPAQRILDAHVTYQMSLAQAATNITQSGLAGPEMIVVTPNGSPSTSVTNSLVELQFYAPTHGTPAVFPEIATNPISCVAFISLLLDLSGA